VTVNKIPIYIWNTQQEATNEDRASLIPSMHSHRNTDVRVPVRVYVVVGEFSGLFHFLTIFLFETGYCLYEQGTGVPSPDRGKNFHFSMSSTQALGFTQPPIKRVMGALSPWVKRPGREYHHSPQSSAEFKKMWIYTSTPPYAFME
jgi:hypothetical protein